MALLYSSIALRTSTPPLICRLCAGAALLRSVDAPYCVTST